MLQLRQIHFRRIKIFGVGLNPDRGTGVALAAIATRLSGSDETGTKSNVMDAATALDFNFQPDR